MFPPRQVGLEIFAVRVHDRRTKKSARRGRVTRLSSPYLPCPESRSSLICTSQCTPRSPQGVPLQKKKERKVKAKNEAKDTPIRREGEPFSRIEEKHFLHVTKATTRVDGSPGISVRTLVAIKVESKDDDVEWKRGRSGETTFWCGRWTTVSTRRFPATGADGRKFAENPRDSKSDAPRMHALRAEEGRSVAYHYLVA